MRPEAPITPRFHAWRAAEREAQDAERRLHDAMLRSARSTSAPGLEELARSARALRQRAHELFEDAMEEMKTVAASLHHRRVLGPHSPRPNATGAPHGSASDTSPIPPQPPAQHCD